MFLKAEPEGIHSNIHALMYVHPQTGDLVSCIYLHVHVCIVNNVSTSKCTVKF